jgi:hypothetical protein
MSRYDKILKTLEWLVGGKEKGINSKAVNLAYLTVNQDFKRRTDAT